MVALHFITHVPKSSQDGKVEKTLFLLFLFKKKSVPMQMNSALILLFTIVSSFGFLMESEYRNEFVQFMREHNKVYQNFEFQHRYQIFKSNLDYIHSFNANNSKIKLRMNQFGDFTSEEFASYNGFTTQAKSMKHGNTFKSNKRELPDSFDWRAKGAVTPIKNQGSCGSCWSFSTTGSTEGCHAIKTGELVGLSEQQLLDCSVSYGNEGCEGGVMTDAMQYIIETGGLETETSYPYAAKDDTCRFNVSDVVATLSSYSNIPQGDEDTLQQAVSVGPVSVAIDASHRSFQFYSSGVYYEPKCSSTSLDHGVLVVGWGADESGDLYWIVKNSWGVSWGLSGYIWMSRNHNNNCGIATMATLPNC